MKTFEILKDLRMSENLSQKELSDKLKIGQSTIAQYEKNLREPNSISLIAYAKFFNVTIEYLLGLEDEYGNALFTQEEKAAGLSATKKVSITPIEEDMLEVFRKVGKKHGESAQQAIITVAEKML